MGVRWNYVTVIMIVFAFFFYPYAKQNPWKKLDKGLSIATFAVKKQADFPASEITIIKINPHYFSFKLLSQKEEKLSEALTVDQWCKKYNLIAAINAGMYQVDYVTNVGYMKNFDYINNGRINSKYFSVFAFNPISSKQKPAALFDIDEVKMQSITDGYQSVVQNLRLIKRSRINKWEHSEQKWSEAALGEDKDGDIVFIFCPVPYGMHEFNAILLSLPISLVCAQHLEGGPQASLYFSYKTDTLALSGGYRFDQNVQEKSKTIFMPLPNVIGFIKKPQK